MILIDQTRFDGPAGGNCLAACLASIFEVPLESIDTIELSTEHIWPAALQRICQAHGYQPFSYAPGGPFPQIAPAGLHIACNETHATVALDGRVLWDPHPKRKLWDPHPKRKGLAEITEWILLFPIAVDG